MLRITIPGVKELWDEKKQEFIPATKDRTIQLEHSLVSLSKWESRWNKAFLSAKEKTTEETIDYIRCMTVTKDVDPASYYRLTSQNIKEINDYIAAPMTATYFSDTRINSYSRDTITSELIYYWLIAFNIPFECQKWHLNRLFALIRVCSVKNTSSKKMSKAEIIQRNRALNKARREQLHTSG